MTLPELVENAIGMMDSPYRAVLVAARRAKQIQRGSSPAVEPKHPRSTTVALQELVGGKLAYDMPEDLDGLDLDFPPDPTEY